MSIYWSSRMFGYEYFTSSCHRGTPYNRYHRAGDCVCCGVCVCVCIAAQASPGLLPTCCRADVGDTSSWVIQNSTILTPLLQHCILAFSHSLTLLLEHYTPQMKSRLPFRLLSGLRFYRIQSANGFWFRMVIPPPFLILSIQFHCQLLQVCEIGSHVSGDLIIFQWQPVIFRWLWRVV